MDHIKVLLIEDEESVASFVKMELLLEGYQVVHAADGEEGLSIFLEDTDQWDLILLDWMLPRLNGLEVCRRIRKISQTPIIMMTARDYVSDKVSALDNGADDYITKPFDIEELLARIRVVIRRQVQIASNSATPSLKAGDLTMDLEKRAVNSQGHPIELTKKEFDLLLILMKNKGEPMSRDRLLNEVWGYEYMGQTNIIDVYIRYLRNKIDGDKESSLIQTVRGVGYVLRDE